MMDQEAIVTLAEARDIVGSYDVDAMYRQLGYTTPVPTPKYLALIAITVEYSRGSGQGLLIKPIELPALLRLAGVGSLGALLGLRLIVRQNVNWGLIDELHFRNGAVWTRAHARHAEPPVDRLALLMEG